MCDAAACICQRIPSLFRAASPRLYRSSAPEWRYSRRRARVAAIPPSCGVAMSAAHRPPSPSPTRPARPPYGLLSSSTVARAPGRQHTPRRPAEAPGAAPRRTAASLAAEQGLGTLCHSEALLFQAARPRDAPHRRPLISSPCMWPSPPPDTRPASPPAAVRRAPSHVPTLPHRSCSYTPLLRAHTGSPGGAPQSSERHSRCHSAYTPLPITPSTFMAIRTPVTPTGPPSLHLLLCHISAETQRISFF